MLLVEQNLEVCVAVADRLHILDGGRIACASSGPDLMRSHDIRARHLTLEHA